MPSRDDTSSRSARSRRDFLKLSALAAAGAAAGPFARAVSARGNVMPGKIILFHDSEMEGHLATINRDQVELDVHHGVRLLMGISDSAAAFEALFPGLHSSSKIAIKVNLVGTCDTRWETVRGIVSGLSLMLGGTYAVSQVTIYDRDPIPYNASQFTFNGHTPYMAYGSNASSHYVYGGYRLSQYLIDADYVINMPSLKSHNDPANQITVTFKCHYGSCTPSSLCGNIDGMLSVSADSYIKDKTALILIDGIRGTYNGGPSTAPMVWNTFPNGTPNTLFFSTDPTTSDYWARELINAERATHGWSPKPCTWVELSSGSPYSLGVSNPADMTVISYDPAVAAVGEQSPTTRGATFFVACIPNPIISAATLRFHLGQAGPARLQIVDAEGRRLRTVAREAFPAGLSNVSWDGRDACGQLLPRGVYFARLKTRSVVRTQRIMIAR